MQTQASFYEAITGAAASLRASKLRSFLTLLGIILATTTLIAVMSIINGMKVYVAEKVSDMGADGFEVRRISMMQWDPKKFLEMMRRNPQLNRDEFDFLRSRVTQVREIGMSSYRGVSVHYGSQTMESVSLQGASPNIAVISNMQPAIGRFYTETENQRHMLVAFIGNDLKDRFFPNVNPLGKTILLQGRPFEVVGVGKVKGTVFGQSQDNYIVIPIETFFKMYGNRSWLGYNAVAISPDHLFRAQEEVRMLLRAWRHQRPKDDDSFAIIASDSLMKFWDQLTGAIAATAVGVVSVFMVVGGVVIMNIMLAAVTERTHEIGIRKSVGARRTDILRQFLVESSMLAGCGGAIGVLIAWSVAVLVRTLTSIPMAVPANAVIVGVGLSTVVGLFFGIYPARRAARLDPIEALRVER